MATPRRRLGGLAAGSKAGIHSALVVLRSKIADIVWCTVETVLTSTNEDIAILPVELRWRNGSDVLYVEIEALGIGKWVDGFGITRHAETHEGVIVFAEL